MKREVLERGVLYVLYCAFLIAAVLSVVLVPLLGRFIGEWALVAYFIGAPVLAWVGVVLLRAWSRVPY